MATDKETQNTHMTGVVEFVIERTEGHPIGVQIVGNALQKFGGSFVAASDFLDRQGVPRGDGAGHFWGDPRVDNITKVKGALEEI